jgi:hypothetical protein
LIAILEYQWIPVISSELLIIYRIDMGLSENMVSPSPLIYEYVPY